MYLINNRPGRHGDKNRSTRKASVGESSIKQCEADEAFHDGGLSVADGILGI